MREYDHFRIGGDIVLADPNSAKAKYGHHTPEYMDSSNPDFLREGMAWFASMSMRVFQLTKPSPGVPMLGYEPAGKGFVVCEIQDCSGGYSEGAIHESRITWEK